MSLPNSSPLGSRSGADRKPLLCYVTDRHSLQAAPQKTSIDMLLGKIELISAAGVDWIQLREKDLSGRSSASLVREALRHVSNEAGNAPANVRVLVNDRLDVAIAEQAGGVHLGESSLPVEDAKRLLAASRAEQIPSRDFILGISCHSLEAAQSAACAGADYIFFGPIFPTPSKAAYGAPQGLDRLAEVCASVTIPVLAIGGITVENASTCFSAGAAGIAAIRLFQDSADPRGIVRALRQLPF